MRFYPNQTVEVKLRMEIDWRLFHVTLRFISKPLPDDQGEAGKWREIFHCNRLVEKHFHDLVSIGMSDVGETLRFAS